MEYGVKTLECDEGCEISSRLRGSRAMAQGGGCVKGRGSFLYPNPVMGRREKTLNYTLLADNVLFMRQQLRSYNKTVLTRNHVYIPHLFFAAFCGKNFIAEFITSQRRIEWL